MKPTLRLSLLAVVAFSTACATPLSMRTARVVEKGAIEVLVSPQAQLSYQISQGNLTGPIPFPWGEASLRFGVADNLDLQLRFDPGVLPEVSVGYQLVGDPARDDDLAVSVTGGVKPAFGILGSGIFYASAPLQVLADFALAPGLSLTGGLRVIPNMTLISGNVGLGVAPGFTGGVRLVLADVFVVHPEFAVSGNVPLLGAASPGGIGQPSLGSGFLSATLGFNVGGTFDFRRAPERSPVVEPAPAPTPEPTPEPTPTPEPAPTAEPAPPPAPLEPLDPASGGR